MSRELKSQPGRGILAPPEDSTIEIGTEHDWPIEETGGEVILTSVRPDHALATSRWSVKCSEGKFRLRQKAQAQTTGVAPFKFKWDNWVDTVESVTVRVEWVNVNSPEAHHEIVLTKPDPE